jgi:hypothetical protein
MEKIEQELKTIKVAHSRLLNQYKELEKKLVTLMTDQKELEKYVQQQLIEMNNTQPPKVKYSLQPDNIYKEEISEIISSNEVEWNNGKYVNYEIKLKDREEIYKAFVGIKYRLLSGFIIKFNYEGSGLLRQVRILD